MVGLSSQWSQACGARRDGAKPRTPAFPHDWTARPVIANPTSSRPHPCLPRFLRMIRGLPRRHLSFVAGCHRPIFISPTSCHCRTTGIDTIHTCDLVSSRPFQAARLHHRLGDAPTTTILTRHDTTLRTRTTKKIFPPRSCLFMRVNHLRGNPKKRKS